MSLRFFQVDAFTDRPFAGNPAGVCLLDGPADAGWMQALAAEQHLPATAFAHPLGAGHDGWGLRWFTPTREIPLCGHATLATSHVLFAELGMGTGPAGDTVSFTTGAGALSARRLDGGWIELDFPAHRPVPGEAPDGLVAALFPAGAASTDGTDRAVDDGPAGPVEVLTGDGELLVILPTVADVLACTPDQAALARVPVRMIVVTAAGPGAEAGGPDIVSRVFAPTMGIIEDPVTGSAHCLLAPYWAARLGRVDLVARQASARGGDLRVGLRGDRVALAGQAVTMARIELTAAARSPS